MFDLAVCQIQGILFLTPDLDHFQDLFPDLDLEISVNRLNVIIVTSWVTQQIIVLDIRTRMFHVDSPIKVGKIITEV